MKQREFKLRKIEMPLSIFGVGKWNAVIHARVDFICNDGIGSYECHGYKGYDHGSDYIEEYTIHDIFLNGKRPDSILYKRVDDALNGDYEDPTTEAFLDLLMQAEVDEQMEEESKWYAQYMEEDRLLDLAEEQISKEKKVMESIFD